MIILSVVAGAARILAVNPFAIAFDISFVYLPTAILILGPLLAKARRKPTVQ